MFSKLAPQTILLVSLLPFFSILIRKHAGIDLANGSKDTAGFGRMWSALCFAAFFACLLVSLIRVSWWAPLVLAVSGFLAFIILYGFVSFSGKWGSIGIVATLGWPFVAFFAIRALL